MGRRVQRWLCAHLFSVPSRCQEFLMVELFYQGSERAVYVYGGCDGFAKWAQKLKRPPVADLLKAVHLVGDLSRADLIRRQYLWKHVSGSKPKLFGIRNDQARIYCCQWKGNIVMLDWVQKKQRRAPKSALQRAQRRAIEVLRNE